MQTTFTERLRLVSKRAGGAAALGEATGIPKRTLDAYIGGETDAPGDRIRKIVEVTGVDAAWLLTGEGDGPSEDGSRPYKTGQQATVKTTDGLPPRYEVGASENFDDFVKIPLYEITASAGNGAWNDGARVKSHLAFRRDWLRECVDVNPDSDGLGLVKAAGDSMPESAPDGAVVMIQPLRHDGYFSEGIHLMLLNGMHVLKYVQRIGVRSAAETLSQDVQLRLISENALYPPIEIWITAANEHETTVIGRAVWMGVPI